MNRPNPYDEIRLLGLRTVRGANFWSRRPVTRMDVWPGAYDDISSAEVAGVTAALVEALPGLWEHRCSIGERGGFVTRLRRGTYAPHIAEHVGLELQSMMGHDVGYGRARGGDRPGEYTVVLEHRHAAVGARAAALALEIVQRAFAGELRRATVDAAVAELAALAGEPDAPRPSRRVLCGVTGGGDVDGVRDRMAALGVSPGEVVALSPGVLLNEGLPYGRSAVAVVLDAEPNDVPERYRDPELARRLVSVVADAVPEGGIVVCPAHDWGVQDLAREAGCRVAVFSAADDVTARDAKVASAVAQVRGGRIVLEIGGTTEDGGALAGGATPEAQVAAALAVRALRGMAGNAGEGAAERDGAAAEQR
ncbi:cyanophycin synthetase [bacterium JGI 053]|nr:cyanophycin synthetase [bacterium JGI 053]